VGFTATDTGPNPTGMVATTVWAEASPLAKNRAAVKPAAMTPVREILRRVRRTFQEEEK
jgi:hypothetical protein